MTKLTHMKFDITFNKKRTSVQIPLYLVIDYGRYILNDLSTQNRTQNKCF